MRRHHAVLAMLFLLGVYLAAPSQTMAAVGEKTLIYDDAHLLSQQDIAQLNAMANEYGAKRETDIIILTSSNPDNLDVVKMTEDFYDEHAPGYDRPHGNAVILTLDMKHREVYLAGFYKSKEYLDDGRLDKIRNKVTSDLTDGDYRLAFQTYIKLAHQYLGVRPGVNPDNILFNIWFQLGGAAAIGLIVVGLMAYRSGGRVTVNGRTYEDASASGILDQQDQFINTTITKRKIVKNNNSGGGGGRSSGGHSHSGSRGSF